MSNPSVDQIHGTKVPLVTELVAETRIDAPHPASHPVPREEEDAGLMPCEQEEALSSPPDPDLVSRQVHTQAAQLAEHLRDRQRELDHREAELNAWAAQLDRDSRAARLWLEERTAELEETAQPAESIVVQEEAIRRMAESLAEKEHRLVEADADLEKRRIALQHFHEQLIADRQLLEEGTQAERERLAADQVRLATELEEKRHEVQQRSEQADQAHAALEQFRAELGRMHRETLEIRLATEELWAELSGSAPPAALTRSLGRIRSRLAEHYRIANLELHQKKEELEQLRVQLSEQYERLVRQKRNFDAWAADCREEVEQQSARLLARGEELDRREADMGEYARCAQAEKLELQQEIRRLRAKLAGKVEAELSA